MYREELKILLKKYGQEHILAYYDNLPDKEKKNLVEQIKNVDWKLLDLVHKEQKTTKRGHFEPIEAMTLKQIEKSKEKFSKHGLEMIKAGKIGAVLLAGGQGTRLGCDGAKGVVNIGVSKDLYIFELLFKNLLQVTKKAGAWAPLYIMTSDKNHDETVTFLEKHHFFGYPEEYVTLFVQEMAPSVDFEGRLLMERPDSLSLSPNGNGGWFSSMVKAGLIEDLQKRGVEWLNIFAVDNVLQQILDPSFIGATSMLNYVCGAKVVRKADPNEGVGVLCLEDGKPAIVEYYEMIDEMRYKKNSDGELSYTFGVILNYIFRLDKLKDILNTNMPIHIAEKKIPNITMDGHYIVPENPNGLKFETFVLDMIHLMDNCLPYEVVREKEFAPIKNVTGVDSLESARELLRKNGQDL